MRGVPTTKLLLLGAAIVLWHLMLFLHPWGEWFGFWNSPFWAATELVLAASALCLGRAWGEAAAFVIGAHWLFYHGVVMTDEGRPVLGRTLELWLDRARQEPIYFGGHVLAALISCHAAVRLLRRLAERPSLP
jgi:hypothetical protein